MKARRRRQRNEKKGNHFSFLWHCYLEKISHWIVGAFFFFGWEKKFLPYRSWSEKYAFHIQFRKKREIIFHRWSLLCAPFIHSFLLHFGGSQYDGRFIIVEDDEDGVACAACYEPFLQFILLKTSTANPKGGEKRNLSDDTGRKLRLRSLSSDFWVIRWNWFIMDHLVGVGLANE